MCSHLIGLSDDNLYTHPQFTPPGDEGEEEDDELIIMRKGLKMTTSTTMNPNNRKSKSGGVPYNGKKFFCPNENCNREMTAVIELSSDDLIYQHEFYKFNGILQFWTCFECDPGKDEEILLFNVIPFEDLKQSPVGECLIFSFQKFVDIFFAYTCYYEDEGIADPFLDDIISNGFDYIETPLIDNSPLIESNGSQRCHKYGGIPCFMQSRLGVIPPHWKFFLCIIDDEDIVNGSLNIYYDIYSKAFIGLFDP